MLRASGLFKVLNKVAGRVSGRLFVRRKFNWARWVHASQMTGVTRERTPSPYHTSELATKSFFPAFGARKGIQWAHSLLMLVLTSVMLVFSLIENSVILTAGGCARTFFKPERRDPRPRCKDNSTKVVIPKSPPQSGDTRQRSHVSKACATMNPSS